MTREPLAGKAALVTGASAGIGEATAHALARDGAAVALAARRRERLETVAETLEATYDAETLVVPTDVTEPEAVSAMVAETVAAFDGLDVLVNNAGVLRMARRLEDLSLEAYHELRAVNVDGMFYVARAGLPHLRESGGTLVFVGSDSGKHPDPLLASYAATKWWTRGFALSLEAREGRHGVAVTVVNPGDTFTDINFRGRPLSETADPEELLSPEEVADAVAFAARQRPGATVSELDVYGRDLASEVYGGLLEEDE